MRAIGEGMDLDGDGRADLNGNRLAYLGQSLGAAYGTLLMAVEPAISTAVLNAGPGTLVDTVRLSPGFRAAAGVPALGLRQPSLLNTGPRVSTKRSRCALRVRGSPPNRAPPHCVTSLNARSGSMFHRPWRWRRT